MEDDMAEALVNTLRGELVFLRQSITRMEEALDGQVVTRKMLEKLIGPAGIRGSKAKIDRDPEVRAYIFEQLAEAQGTIAEIAERAQDKFGKQRAPSGAALHRYIAALRKKGMLQKVMRK